MNRHVFKLDELGREIAQIALPAALALAADPVASLVDTAFIGQIGNSAFLLKFSRTLFRRGSPNFSYALVQFWFVSSGNRTCIISPLLSL